MRFVSTAIWTSAEPVSPADRACSWMIWVLASLVNVMVEDQGYQRERGADLGSRGPEGGIGNDLDGSPDVRLDRGDQLLHVVVADLVPEPGPELDREGLPREVPIEPQQERLDVQRLHAERGVGADVDRRSVPPSGVFRDPRVDPLAREEQPWPGAEVGGRIPEPSSPSVAG